MTFVSGGRPILKTQILPKDSILKALVDEKYIFMPGGGQSDGGRQMVLVDRNGRGVTRLQEKQHEALCKQWALTFTVLNYPLNSAEHKLLKQTTKMMEPSFNMPCRKTITRKYIPLVHEELEAKARLKLASARHIAGSMDQWTNPKYVSTP